MIGTRSLERLLRTCLTGGCLRIVLTGGSIHLSHILLPEALVSPTDTRRVAPWLVLAAILTTQLMIVLDATIVNVALPHIQTALGFSPTGLSWVINAYTLAFGGLLLLGARAGDLLGRRRVLIAGIGLFVVASFLGGFAQTAGQLLAARAVQGVGAAFAAPSVLALLVGSSPRGASAPGPSAGSPPSSIGGSAVGLHRRRHALIQWVSWRWVFFVNVPIGLALDRSSAGARPRRDRAPPRPVRPRRRAHRRPSARPRVVYGFVRAASDGWADPVTVGAFLAGARADQPVHRDRAARRRRRSRRSACSRTAPGRVALLARVLLVAGMMGMFFYLTQFLQDILGYTPIADRPGLPAADGDAVRHVAGVGGLMGRVEPRMLMVGGLMLSTSGLLLLSRLSADSGYLGGPRAAAAVRHRQRARLRAADRGVAHRGRARSRRARPPAWSTSRSRWAARSAWRSW